MPKVIFHIDMDYFFAAVEIRQNPSLKGKPVIVGAEPKAGKGRGVVSTCSYDARKLGIHSAMPISKAYRLCPDAVFLPVNMSLYIEVSNRIMDILRKYADKFQQISIDEAFLDVTKIAKKYKSPEELAKKIKKEIGEKERLTCSIGVGPNKSVAKIASDFRKPDGLTIVKPSKVKEFLRPLPVRKIAGIGPKTEQRLKELRIETIGQLAGYDVEKLADEFGTAAYWFNEVANGIDDDVVEEEEGIKSISRETTFEQDTDDKIILHNTINELARDVHDSLIEEGYYFRTVSIKVRFAGFETHTRARTLPHYTTSLAIIKRTAKQLLQEFIETKRKIRLLGVRLSSLEVVGEKQKLVIEYLK